MGRCRYVAVLLLYNETQNYIFPDATDMPLERKVPIDYYDGVFSPSGNDRPNVMIISNLTFDGLTGQGSEERTALFTFYGKKL